MTLAAPTFAAPGKGQTDAAPSPVTHKSAPTTAAVTPDSTPDVAVAPAAAATPGKIPSPATAHLDGTREAGDPWASPLAAPPAEPPAAAAGAESPATFSQRGPAGATPVGNPRYAMPTEPAPQIGYAPAIAGPLPGYPGIGATTMPMAGSPSQALNIGPLVRLFTDLKASGPGDVLTVVITQSATAASGAEKSSSRATSGTMSAGTGALRFLPGMTFGWQGSTDGKSANTGNFSIATTFTVVITAVLPNGNFQVEGEQQVRMDGKPQGVKIVGEVRPYDIDNTNSVQSTQVANVKIDWTGIRAPQEKGILATISKTLNSLFGWMF
jgi:flagellar L-ring protein precursor FlgH